MDIQPLQSLGLSHGFSRVAIVDIQDLKLSTALEIRSLCAANVCGLYGTTWCCPPAIGSVEDCVAELLRHSTSLVVQFIGTMEDSYDYESSGRTLQTFRTMIHDFLPTAKDYGDVLPLGAGGCSLCPQCSYPKEPCRHPEQAHASVESYGINVMMLCKLAGLPYHSGKNTVTFTGLYLFHQED